MQGKCWLVPIDANGTPAMHATTVYKVFATWADDGSLWQAFITRVRPLAAEQHLDTSVLHGDGTNTVAKKGAMGWATRATHISRGSKSSPASTIMAPSERRSPWLRSMNQPWSCDRRACKRCNRWPKRSVEISVEPPSTSMVAVMPHAIGRALSMRG